MLEIYGSQREKQASRIALNLARGALSPISCVGSCFCHKVTTTRRVIWWFTISQFIPAVSDFVTSKQEINNKKRLGKTCADFCNETKENQS